MPKSFVVSLALAFSPGSVLAEPATYVIDPEHVSVEFRVDHLGFADVVAFFRTVEGSYVFDEEIGVLSDIQVRVSTESVFSNHEDRDDHVRSRDFLDSSTYPDLQFTFLSAERISDREFLINGELQLLGIRKPLQLEATWNKSGPYPIGRGIYAMGVAATGRLQRSDYGMDYGVDNGWVGDEVEILIEFEARRE